MTKMYSLSILLLFFSVSILQGQHFNCATPALTEAQRDNIQRNIKTIDISNLRNDNTTCIPIRVFAIPDDAGANTVTEAELMQGLAATNATFLPMGVEFFYSEITYHNSSDFNDFDDRASDPNGADNDTDMAAFAGEVTNAINLYVVKSLTFDNGQFNAAGYAYFPANAAYSNRIVMINTVFDDGSGGTFDHELGHYFSLPHTFDGTSNGNTHANAENVPRTGGNANCSTHGDMICDTAAAR